MSKPRFIVYGAGAIGGLVGALISEAGEDVVLIARGAHAAAMRSDGLIVEYPDGSRTVDLAVVEDPGAARITDSDVILLAMKSQDTAAALSDLRRTAPPSVPVACLQNGVDNERMALRVFENVYAVCVLCPAAHLDPGVVQAFGWPLPGLFDLGRYPFGVDKHSAMLAATFEAATFASVNRPDIMAWKYRKLILNLGNAGQATLGLDGRSEINELAQKEGEACLSAAGIDVISEADDLVRRGNLMSSPPPPGAKKRDGGSTWQSLRRGTGSIESDFLNGEIVLLGRLYGVPTPVNSLLQEVAREMSLKRATPNEMSVSEFRERLAGNQQEV